MGIEDQLRERLRKVEALYFGATSAGEREAAGAAAERLKARLDEASRLDPPVEMKFSLAGRMVGAIVHRPVSSVWLSTVPLRASAPHDDHGEGAAAVLRRGGVAAVLRRAHGSVDPFPADDGEVDQGGDLRRHAGRRDDGRAEPARLTTAHAASSFPPRARLSSSRPEARGAGGSSWRR